MSDFKLGPIQEKWLTFLEENEHLQGKCFLGFIERHDDGSLSDASGMCCLGAGKFVLSDGKLPAGKILDGGEGGDAEVLMTSYEALGLACPNGRVIIGSYLNLEGFTTNFFTLTGINDAGVPWPVIASTIRKQPEKFFTHAV